MRLNLVSEKLCKSLLFKYVFSFTMQLLVLKLLQVKVVKVLFGHPVYKVQCWARSRARENFEI